MKRAFSSVLIVFLDILLRTHDDSCSLLDLILSSLVSESHLLLYADTKCINDALQDNATPGS